MAMPIALQDVTSPRRVAAFVFRNQTSDERAMLEIYTGWLHLDFTGDDSAPVNRTELVSFLPFETSSNSVSIQEYQPNRKLHYGEATVVAAVSSVADFDDEANVEAVDVASVEFSPQLLPGVGGDPNVLLLRVSVGALAAKIHGIAYQVSVLSDLREVLEVHKIEDIRGREKIDPHM